VSELLEIQEQLQNEANELLSKTAVLSFLHKLGEPIQTGSSITGLMVYPDIDFSVQNDNLNINDAIAITESLFKELGITALKIADFRHDENGDAGYYIGFELPFNGKTWHIDATVTKKDPIGTNPPELAEWINNMGHADRLTILELKKQLIDSKRYVGARSQPPYTFRSAHLYEAVLLGGAKSISDLEGYFK
jgi:hypothetical protein